MSLSKELERIQALYDAGNLSDEEYIKAKDRILAEPEVPSESQSVLHRFQRSRRKALLGGVCSGIAEISDTPSWVWRFLFTFAFFLGGISVVVYILLWIFVPQKSS